MDSKGSTDKDIDNLLNYIFSSNTSSEDKIDALYEIIDIELQKDTPDDSLIEECSSYLDELQKEELPLYSEEELEKKLQALKAKALEANLSNSNEPAKIVETSNDELNSKTPKDRLIIWKRWRKLANACAASFVSIFLLTTFLVQVYGYDTYLDFITKSIDKIFEASPGEKIDGDGFTVIKNNGIVRYSSVEEMLDVEHLDIFIPSYFPENIKIEEVDKVVVDSGERLTYHFRLDKKNINFYVTNSYMNEFDNWKSYSVYRYRELEFYIINGDGINYYATCQYNGYQYVINYNNYEEIINMINSMRGITK